MGGWPTSSLLCAEPLFRVAGTALTALPSVPGVWKKALEADGVVSFGVCGVCEDGEEQTHLDNVLKDRRAFLYISLDVHSRSNLYMLCSGYFLDASNGKI